jgi:DNA-binding transcriptional MocR family regulator
LDRRLDLDLTRGKPSPEQLDLSNELLSLPRGFLDRNGVDVRNYGGLQGLLELREIFAELLRVAPEQLVAGGNSSLTMMNDALSYLLRHGGPESSQPWAAGEVSFICPVPGYDRHFTLLEHLGIRMVTVPMLEDGPDVEAVARLAAADKRVKGLWVVPTYSNPSGAVTTHEIAARLATMHTAASDFRIFWDNAYGLHHLTDDEPKSAEVLGLAHVAGHPDRVLVFASTSKVTFAGAGVGFLAASLRNVEWFLGHQAASSIGPDKVNHLRHAQFFGDADGVREHMRRHRAVLEPKFVAVQQVLTARLAEAGVATWNTPRGGYFVNLNVVPGTAARVVALAGDVGLQITPAGSTYPYGRDELDHNLRLAPTVPSLDEVREATDVLATCILLAAVEHRLSTARDERPGASSPRVISARPGTTPDVD